MAKAENEKKRGGLLDENFVLIFSYVWKILYFLFRIVRFLIVGIFKVFGLLFKKPGQPEAQAEPAPEFAPSAAAKPVPSGEKVLDSRAFQNYGSIRWVHDLTIEALRNMNREENPEPEILNIKYTADKEEKTFEIFVYGALREGREEPIRAAIQDIVTEDKISETNLREIDVIGDLGKFLNTQGVPERKVVAFSIDAHGVQTILMQAAADREICDLIYTKVLDDDLNYMAADRKARETLWNQPESIRERLEQSREYTAPDTKYKHGAFRGRHVIDMDTKLAGGVYPGLPAREAIVIPEESETLNSIFIKLVADIRKVKESLGLSLEERILFHVMKLAQSTMPRNTASAVKTVRDEARVAPDEELSLDHFIIRETGEADHLALLAGYLIERLAREYDHYISGRVSIDRNWLPGGGHAWIRYTHSPSDIYIVDPGKNYCGRLDDYSVKRWPYERAADLARPRKARPLVF